jgi:hypothetical protein
MLVIAVTCMNPCFAYFCPLTYDRQVSRHEPGRIGNAVRPDGQIGSGCAAVTGDGLSTANATALGREGWGVPDDPGARRPA